MQRDAVRQERRRLGGTHEARRRDEGRDEEREGHDVEEDGGEERLVVPEHHRERRLVPRDVVGDLEIVDQDVENRDGRDDEAETSPETGVRRSGR